MSSVRDTAGRCGWCADYVFAVCRRAYAAVSEPLTLAEIFLVGLITSAARIRRVACCCRYCCIWKQPCWAYCWLKVIFKYNFYEGVICIPPDEEGWRLSNADRSTCTAECSVLGTDNEVGMIIDNGRLIVEHIDVRSIHWLSYWHSAIRVLYLSRRTRVTGCASSWSGGNLYGKRGNLACFA